MSSKPTLNTSAKNKKINKQVNKVKEQKPTLKEQMQYFDKKYSQKKQIITYAISIILIVAISLAFQLKWYFVLVVAASCMYIMPRIMLALAENKFEDHKFEETTNYVEQMLYSFRRNSKILSSLEDTLLLFPDGDMHDAISQAIEYIHTADTEGNIYEEALNIIEQKYECRRVKSLHRYLIRVEGIGGDHDVGIHALITDRRLWMDRIEEFKKEKSNTLKEVIVATIFSSIVCVITLYMLPNTIDAAHNIIIQTYATIYIVANLFNVKAAITRLILRINDIENEEHDQYMLKKLDWYKHYNKKAERKKSFGILMICGVIIVAGIILKQYFAIGLGVLMAVYGYFLQPVLKYRNTKKSLVNEIETVYPDWLLELSLLLQTDNFHVALEKTLNSAPLLIRPDLKRLAEEIIIHPTEVEPYMQFFDYLPLQNIHSSMKLLYSISEFGTTDEQKQIAELIERNSSLMNKAEEHKNVGRLSRVYVLKFIPMGTSALKLIVDMGVFLVLFITQSLSLM